MKETGRLKLKEIPFIDVRNGGMEKSCAVATGYVKVRNEALFRFSIVLE